MMKAVCYAIGLLCGALCAPAFGKDVLLYKVSKGFHYQQTLTVAPTILTENGYVFEAQVNLALPGAVTSAMVESTEGTDRVLVADGDDQFEFRNRVNSRSTLDTRYPDGPFTMTINGVQDGRRMVTLALTGNSYPAAPRIANLPELQSINANGYVVVRWDAFSGGSAGDFVQLRIEETDGDLVYETHDFGEIGALDGTANYVILEPDTLKPGTTYEATLRFDKTSDYGITTYVGVPGWSTHHALTRFSITTTSATAPPIESYTLKKGQRFEQKTAGPPLPDLNDEFVFSAELKFASSDAEFGGLLTPPVGEAIAMSIEPGASSYTERLRTKEALDAAYPNGVYSFTVEMADAIRGMSLAIAGDAYPPTPQLMNFNPAEEVRADRNLVFEWVAWGDGMANDFIQLRIEDKDDKKVFETKDFGEKGALNGHSTWTIVPVGTLQPGKEYKGTLEFMRVVTLDNTSGMLGLAAYYSRTKFDITTGPPDVAGFRVAKGREYRQMNATNVIPDGRFVFSAIVTGSSTTSLQSVSLEVPGRGVVPLTLQADGRTYSLAEAYTTQQALDAAFPNGTYRLVIRGANDGVRAFSMDIVGDEYPNPPLMDDYAGLGQLFPWFDFTLSWSPFEGGRSRDFIQLDIQDQNGATVYASGDYRQSGSMGGLNTAIVIPAEVMQFNAAYAGRLMFERITTIQDPGYPGVEGMIGYFSRTKIAMVTLGDGNPTSFLGWSRAPDGALEFGFPTVVGGTYVIEGSGDLVNWAPVNTLIATQDVSVFRVQPGTPQFFYRAALMR
jgi:hypothetical protein